MDDLSPDTSAAPAERTPQTEAQAILARATGNVPQGQGAGEQPSTDRSPSAGGTAPAPLTGKVTVNWNGAAREVDIDELVKRDIERGPVESLNETVEAKLQELGVLKTLGKTIQGWNPTQQQRFQEILANPSLLEVNHPSSNGNGNGHSHETDEDDTDMDLTRPAARAPAAQGADPEIARIKQALGYVLQRFQTQDQTQEKQSLEATVTEKLKQFSVFKNDPGALETARGHVMDHLVAHPDAKADDAVARMASWTQGLLEKAGARGLSPLAARGDAAQPGSQPFRIDAKKLSADMESGAAVSQAEALFNQFLQGTQYAQQ